MRAPLASLSLLLVAGCSSPMDVPATEVLVTVDATSSVRVHTTTLTVQISSSTRREGPYTMAMNRGFGPPAAAVGFPRRLALVPLNDDPSRFFEVQATAFQLDPTTMTMSPVATTLVRSGYLPHRLLQLSIVLDDRPCPAPCPSDQTCRHGVCSAIFVDPGLLPDADAGTDGAPSDGADGGDGAVPDAGEGGPADGAADGGDAGCTRDRECDDGDKCDGEEKCVETVCQPGTPLVCDDMVACTVDSCTATMGCVFTPMDTLCTDVAGGHCDATGGCQYPTCTAATCMPDGPTCMNATCVGATCMRTPVCTASQTCCGGMCIASCDDANPCTTDACDPSMHRCTHVNNMIACSDGNPCTVNDKCTAGTCVSGSPMFCDDMNSCTFDSCVPPGGCHSTALAPGSVCDDGNGCTSGDHCIMGGSCVGTSTGMCDDGNPCTFDSCDGTGGCVYMVAGNGSACSDPLNCVMSGSCVSGMCVSSPCAAGLTCCPTTGACIDSSSTCL